MPRAASLIAYYDQNKQIQGYASLYQTAQGIEVQECIYLNSVALFKLLNLALQAETEIIPAYHAQDEHLGKDHQGRHMGDYGFTMARINDYDLFNRLYGARVTSPKGSAFAELVKPLFMQQNTLKEEMKYQALNDKYWSCGSYWDRGSQSAEKSYAAHSWWIQRLKSLCGCRW